nr:MAG TPA: hypothetical protein [Caudoviricetes sp.]
MYRNIPNMGDISNRGMCSILGVCFLLIVGYKAY